jgi:hypothetical protein
MDWLEKRVRQLEHRLDLRIILRPVHVPDTRFRGRILKRPGRIVLEYRDEVPGFFWDYDILRELFAHLETGETDLSLYDEETRSPGP